MREHGAFNFMGSSTDYWVSQGRKFCEFCKCSIADNKPSIQFHENGKKHKENVAKRLTEMQKKASKEAKDAVNFEKEMKKIEAAALKAYAKDVGSGGDYTSHLIRSGLETLPETEAAEPEPKGTRSKGAEKDPEGGRKWREALSEGGQKYYWNSETGESVWEPPKEGFVPVESHGRMKQKTAKQGNQHKPKKGKGKAVVKKESKSKGSGTKADEPVPFYRGHPYGTWKKVEPLKEETVDLQLPRQEVIPIAVPRLADDRERKFKEKILQPEAGTPSTTAEAVFKKRKNVSDLRKNMRQRLNED